MSSRRRRGVLRETLTERGYEVSERNGYTLAEPLTETDRIGVPGSLRIVTADTDPTVLLEAIGSASRAGETALFVAHPDDASAVKRVLTDPPGLAAQTDRTRRFYSVPDRLPAGGKGLACCRAENEPVWREEPVDGGDRFVLYADGDPITAFESLEELSCPSATAFEYAYRRDDDGRFQVEKLATGRTVGRFASVRELRRNAYRPVPVPLVPEAVVEGYLPEAWGLATVDGDRVVATEGA